MEDYNYYYSDQVYTSSATSTEAAAAAATAGALLFVIGFIALVATYIIMGIFLGMIFKKAGVKPWIAWVPFYNTWKMLEIGGQKGYWAVLALIPFVGYVSTVFMYISMYHIGKKLGKDGTFVLLGIFLPVVWFIWLGVDKSTWNDKAATAPSLHKG